MKKWLARRPFLAGVLCGVAGVLAATTIVNNTPIADWLVGPLLVRDGADRADAIVVLGAGVVGGCEPNQNGVRRVLLAARKYREGLAPIVLFTGGPSGEACTIGTAMASLARDIGIPAAAIRVEERSRSTWENGQFSAPLLHREGARRLLLVTDRLHMLRAAGVFSRLGFEVESASVPIYAGHADNVSMLTAAIREVAALAYYRLRHHVAPLTPFSQSPRVRTAPASGI
jgi:uncharacterized SAM-binding protein YcdF (DUF218 family)